MFARLVILVLISVASISISTFLHFYQNPDSSIISPLSHILNLSLQISSLSLFRVNCLPTPISTFDFTNLSFSLLQSGHLKEMGLKIYSSTCTHIQLIIAHDIMQSPAPLSSPVKLLQQRPQMAFFYKIQKTPFSSYLFGPFFLIWPHPFPQNIFPCLSCPLSSLDSFLPSCLDSFSPLGP